MSTKTEPETVEPLAIEIPADAELTDEAFEALAEMLIEDWERESK
jgi:hypothetical protein